MTFDQNNTVKKMNHADALASPNPRTRWGAARVFNQHFRDLTSDPALLAALEQDLNDPVPYVRLEAASGIWRWYYWQVDQPEMRRSTQSCWECWICRHRWPVR